MRITPEIISNCPITTAQRVLSGKWSIADYLSIKRKARAL